jgi:hypothetical protein
MTINFIWQGDNSAWKSAGDTASWHYLLDAPAATVQARTVNIVGQPTTLEDAYWVLASVPATIVGGYLPGILDELIGRAEPLTFQFYAYDVRAAIAEGSPKWEITEG